MTDSRPSNRRSLKQNDFFHGVFLPAFRRVLQQAGVFWSAGQCKELLKGHLHTELDESDFVENSQAPVVFPSGKVIKPPFSTRDLNTKGMEKFMDAARAFAAVDCGGAQLPFPNETPIEAYHDR